MSGLGVWCLVVGFFLFFFDWILGVGLRWLAWVYATIILCA